MKLPATALLLAVLPLAADAPGFALWKAADLKNTARALAPKVANGIFSEPLANMGNYTFARVLRTSSGTAEVHETMADIFVIQAGEPTLVTGGTVVDAKTTQPHEIRGPAIAGGAEHKLGPGDILTIPAGMPHQMKLDAGKQVTYVAIKVAQ
jgi:mannose-6-phosphate isomerase-like protein (cupin superfamily)